MNLGNGITLQRKKNGRYILRIEKSGILATKEFSSYETWEKWAKDVLRRVPGRMA